MSVDELLRRVQQAHPGDQIVQVGWGEAGPDAAWNVRTQSPEGHRIHTFVDQFSGRITGRHDYHHSWMQWCFDLHAYLLAGDVGERVNGGVALATLLASLSGLVVWWPGAPRWRVGFRYHRRASWRGQNYDLHKVVGFVACGLLAPVAFSGGYFAFPAVYQQAARRLTSTPVVVGPPRALTTLAARRVPLEAFVEAAEAAQPGARAVALQFPRRPGDPVTVRTKEPRDWHRIGLNFVYLEPADAQVLRSDRFAEASMGTKAILLMSPLHFGRFGGRTGSPVLFYGVMALYVLIGLSGCLLAVSGLLMYGNRALAKRRSVRRLAGLHPTGTRP